MFRRQFALTGLLLLMFAPLARADQPVIYARSGVAAGGYDVVAYFTVGKPVRGVSDHAVLWKGAVWLFVSSVNRERFEMNPYAFAPRYGGYCSYSVSQGYAASADPLAWRIHDGRLYLTHSREVFRLWQQDIPGHVRRANANWPEVLRN